MLDVNLEDRQFKNFTKHLDKDVAKKCLFSVSQDTHFSEIRCENHRKGDVDIQIKLTIYIAKCLETLDITITSINLRTKNNKVYAFANIPATKN